MRDVIKQILSEETKDPELIKKGIRTAVKILKNDYPFIIEPKFNFDWSRPTRIYIDVICDSTKVSEFYNADIKWTYRHDPYYMRREEFPYPFSILDMPNELDDEKKFFEFRKLEKFLNEIYEIIPDDLKDFDRWGEIKTIDIDHFKFV